MVLKIDIEKAFDTLNWQFLDSIMRQMHFGEKWRLWIRGCLSSSRLSVLTNGNPTQRFQTFRGVRQGDPLAPFLFIIAMEGLHTAIQEANQIGIFKVVSLPNNGPFISHLLYADDVIFTGERSPINIMNLLRILRCF